MYNNSNKQYQLVSEELIDESVTNGSYYRYWSYSYITFVTEGVERY